MGVGGGVEGARGAETETAENYPNDINETK